MYYDFGISGLKENRLGFQAMLQAARNQESDLVITKSVSRFCCNTYILLEAACKLKELGAGVIFEQQHFST
ncbi:MAG: recombinase family protein [Oscillospiraceae bacterium]|nr:recombinase family protein [Oscillospiraceae bacterium]